MMPCPRCSAKDEQGNPLPFDKDGKPLRGLRQASKTLRRDVVERDPSRGHERAGVHPNAAGSRMYRCQDCGAHWRLTYNAVTGAHADELVLAVIEGGARDS